MAHFQSSITRQTHTTSPSFATKPNQNTQPAPHSQTNRTKTHNQPLIRNQTEPKHTTSPSFPTKPNQTHNQPLLSVVLRLFNRFSKVETLANAPQPDFFTRAHRRLVFQNFGSNSEITILGQIPKSQFWVKFRNHNFGSNSEITILGQIPKSQFWVKFRITILGQILT